MQYKNFTNRADLLEAAAHSIRMQEKAGINPVYKYGAVIGDNWSITGYDKNWEFPLAVIEGKPVFEGDELYCETYGKCKALSRLGRNLTVMQAERSYPICVNLDELSWNPPKPKTVMVEMLAEDVEYFTTFKHVGHAEDKWNRMTKACRKALEN